MLFHNTDIPSTAIHRLHPFTKMVVGIGFSGLALWLKNPIALSVLLGFMLIVLAIARVRLTRRQWVSICLFLSVISTLNYLSSQNTTHAATYSIRFAVFLTAMPVLAATTDPQQMTQALSATPLPSGLTMAILLVWRFFPLVAQDVQQMRQAAKLRGKTAERPVLQLYRGLLIPLAFCVMEYTDRITLALELRGFTPEEKRTCYRPLKAGMNDVGFGMAAVVAACSAICLQWKILAP